MGRFEIAAEVFGDPFLLTLPIDVVDFEERMAGLGRVANQSILVVVYTCRGEPGEEIIRIISARKATRRERGFYEETR